MIVGFLLLPIYANFQTSISKKIRKQCNIDISYLIEWDITMRAKPEINFRKKEISKI